MTLQPHQQRVVDERAELADRLLCLQAGVIMADCRRGSFEFDVALQALRAD